MQSVSDFISGGATPRRARANAVAEIPPSWLPPWQSKVVKIKFYIEVLWL